MWGQLGTITLKPPLVPVSFRLRYGFGFAEKNRISGKSGLQQVPDKLYDPSLRFQVHYLEGNLAPQGYLQQFLDLAAAKEAIPFIVGDEAFGNYVITDVSTKLERFSPNGRLLEVAWEVKLLEYADQPERQKQRIGGFLKRIRS